MTNPKQWNVYRFPLNDKIQTELDPKIIYNQTYNRLEGINFIETLIYIMYL